ncbi:fructose-bisphosphate aldolase class I [Candidatus Uhrbacteria bacterium]|nr:fructose-bisphosphate aldolase class I [Candidatus Uhrbacteria bacterium]
MLEHAQTQQLNQIAKRLVEPGKGILAADESNATIEKRLAKINVPSTEENRRSYREMLFTTKGIREYISGVILYEETIMQSTHVGVTFVKTLEDAGVMAGIKIDQGTKEMEGSANEKVTKGLDGLADRLKKFQALGAKFAKWRAVITIGQGLPTRSNIVQNAKDLAQYALVCQQVGVVPIVEPEVLMDGAHDMARCEEVSQQVLEAVFEQMAAAGVALEGMILKTNMVVPGKESGQKATSAEIAEATLRLFESELPPTLPGQAFLSGGQSEVEATANLNEMAKRGPFAWNLSFSYGRALQDSALKTWAGKPENVAAAQKGLLHRAKMNSLATLGKYSDAAEQKAE